jgi:hypothetical protein
MSVNYYQLKQVACSSRNVSGNSLEMDCDGHIDRRP